MENRPLPYNIGTKIGSFGTIRAVKGSKPRDYLLMDSGGTVSWLDEMAITAILESTKVNIEVEEYE